MNVSTYRYLPPTLLALLGAACAVTAFAQRSDVLPPARRATAVELSAELIARRDVPAVLPTIKNPFAPPDFDRVDPVEKAAVAPGPAPRARSTREILETISASINPTGTMFLRDEPILLFGARQMKIGDQLSVTMNGVPYTIVIAGIERTSFTLRLNNEQISRPIKPGSKQ